MSVSLGPCLLVPSSLTLTLKPPPFTLLPTFRSVAVSRGIRRRCWTRSPLFYRRGSLSRFDHSPLCFSLHSPGHPLTGPGNIEGCTGERKTGTPSSQPGTRATLTTIQRTTTTGAGRPLRTATGNHITSPLPAGRGIPMGATTVGSGGTRNVPPKAGTYTGTRGRHRDPRGPEPLPGRK